MGHMGCSDCGARGLAAHAKFAFAAGLAACVGLMPVAASAGDAEAPETIAATEFFGETLDEPLEPTLLAQNGISAVRRRDTAPRRSAIAIFI